MFGIKYLKDKNKKPKIIYTALNGDEIEINKSDLNEALDSRNLIKLKIAPEWFPGVSAFEGGSIPWHDFAGIERESIDQLLRKTGKKVSNGNRKTNFRGLGEIGSKSAITRNDRSRKQLFASHYARFHYGTKPSGSGVNARTPESFIRTDRRDARRDVNAIYVLKDEVRELFRNASIGLPVVMHLKSTPENAQVFKEAIERSKKDNKYGSAVYVYDQSEYADMDLFLAEGEMAGFAVKKDGDIVSVFNSKGSNLKGVSVPFVHLALQMGGKKLDAFDTVLPSLYQMSGLSVESRISWDESQKPPDWDKNVFADFREGDPDVVFMRFDPSNYKLYRPTDGTHFKEFEDAESVRDASIVSTKAKEAKIKTIKERVEKERVSSDPWYQASARQLTPLSDDAYRNTEFKKLKTDKKTGEKSFVNSGFNPNRDQKALRNRTLENLRKVILRPNLLGWIVGNGPPFLTQSVHLQEDSYNKSFSFDYLVGGYDGSFDVKQSARERIASGLEHKFPMAGNISSYANIPQEELWEVVQNPDHVIQFQPMKYHLFVDENEHAVKSYKGLGVHYNTKVYIKGEIDYWIT